MEINEEYKEKSNLKQIRTAISVDPFKSISLQRFFTYSVYKNVRGMVKTLEYKEKRKPNLFYYKESKLPKHVENIFNSEKVLEVLSKVLDKRVKKVELKAYLFSWKHYTIIHDRNLEPEGIDIIFDLTDDWHHRFGGSIMYVDGKGNYNEVPASGNTLTIAKRQKGQQKYIQYINNLSRGTKRFVLIGKVS